VIALFPVLADAVYPDTYLDGFNLALLVARLILGVTLALHGYKKFFLGGRIPGTARWFDSMGMKPNGKIHAVLAGTTELTCGTLMILGLLTPFAAAGYVGLMIVAAWTVHRPHGFWSDSGWEYTMILASFAVLVSLVGPGEYSLDWIIGMDLSFNPVSAALISLGMGISGGVGLLVACYRPPTPNDA